MRPPGSLEHHYRLSVMLNHSLKLLLILFVCGTQAVTATTPEAPEVLAALERLDAQRLRFYRIDVSETASGSTRHYQVETGASDLDSRAVLLDVDGNPPNEKQLQEFLEEQEREKEAEAALAKEGKTESGIFDMIDAASLQLKETTAEATLWSFRPVLEGMEAASEKLEGLLFCNLGTGRITRLEIRNRAPFKPDSKVKIREFQLAFDFVDLPDVQEPVMQRIETRIKGSAMLVVSIDEHSTIEFSRYEKLPTPGIAGS
jgi:hypothetical protein